MNREKIKAIILYLFIKSAAITTTISLFIYIIAEVCSHRFKKEIAGTFIVAGGMFFNIYFFYFFVVGHFFPHSVYAWIYSTLIPFLGILIVILISRSFWHIYKSNIWVVPLPMCLINLIQRIFSVNILGKIPFKLASNLCVFQIHFIGKHRKQPVKFVRELRSFIQYLDNNLPPCPCLCFGFTPFDLAWQLNKVSPKNIKCYGEVIRSIPWERSRRYGEERPWTFYFIYVPGKEI